MTGLLCIFWKEKEEGWLPSSFVWFLELFYFIITKDSYHLLILGFERSVYFFHKISKGRLEHLDNSSFFLCSWEFIGVLCKVIIKDLMNLLLLSSCFSRTFSSVVCPFITFCTIRKRTYSRFITVFVFYDLMFSSILLTVYRSRISHSYRRCGLFCPKVFWPACCGKLELISCHELIFSIRKVKFALSIHKRRIAVHERSSHWSC